MSEFWESAYQNHAKMWGEQPTDNAYSVLELFNKYNIQNVLVPGFGYGRNAKVFYQQGIKVTGIEISKTAIQRAQNNFGNEVVIYHGSVVDMPFDNLAYDAVYCYSLIHLLNGDERKKLIADCYDQLVPKGIMVFIALSVEDIRYREGVELETNTFRSAHGLDLFFYDQAAVEAEFGAYNVISTQVIHEPLENPTEKMWMVVCQKHT